MRILLTGLGGYRRVGLFERNRGNTAILLPMLRVLRDTFPKATIDTTIRFSRELPYNVNIISVPIFPTRWFTSFLRYIFKRPRHKNYDVILSWNGDLFSNTRHKSFLLWYVWEVLAARRKGSLLIEWASSPGPFETTFHKILGKIYYNKVDFIMNRDFISKEHLRVIGISPLKIMTIGCPSWLNFPSGHQKSESVGVGIIPTAGSNLEELINVIIYFQYIGVNVKIFPHSYIQEDVQACRTLYHSLVSRKNVELIIEEKSHEELKKIIGNLEMLVTCRLHAGVVALTQDVPTVFVPYGHKFDMVKPVGIVKEEKQDLLNLCISCYDSSNLYTNVGIKMEESLFGFHRLKNVISKLQRIRK